MIWLVSSITNRSSNWSTSSDENSTNADDSRLQSTLIFKSSLPSAGLRSDEARVDLSELTESEIIMLLENGSRTVGLSATHSTAGW
jgi:hypothetical protein